MSAAKAPGCGFTASGDTEEALIDKVAVHAAQDHGAREMPPGAGRERSKPQLSASTIDSVIVTAADASDEVLVARAAAGDDSAFEALVVRYQHRVFRLACRLASQADAPDVVQDVFLQIYRHLSTFRGDARFSTWIYRIATNTGLMHRRARRRRPAEPLDEFMPRFDADQRHAQTPEALRVMSRVDELMDRHVLAKKVQAALERLPDLYREAFVLRDLEELSTADVAQVLGVEPATVRQRVHRARLMMRGYLSELARSRP